MMGKQSGQIQMVILDIDSMIPEDHLLGLAVTLFTHTLLHMSNQAFDVKISAILLQANPSPYGLLALLIRSYSILSSNSCLNAW